MQSPAPGPPMLGLKTAGFRAFLSTQFLGAFNDNAYKFLLISHLTAWAAGDLERIGESTGIAQGAFALPFVVLAGWAGSVADRFRKSTVFIWAKIAEIAIMVGAVIAFRLDHGQALVAVLFLMGTQSTFFGPAKYGYLGERVAPGDLSRANGVVNMTTFAAIIFGQITGGLLYDLFPGNLAVAAMFLVAVAVAGTLTSLGIPRSEVANPGGRLLNPFPELLQTWREVRGQRALLYTVLGIGHFYLLAALLQLTLFSYAELMLNTTKTGAGAFVAIALAGIASGSLLASRWSERKVELGLVPLGALGMSAFLFLLGLIPKGGSAWQANLCVLFMGVGGGLFIVPLMSNLQLLAPAQAKGRFLAFGNMVSFIGIFLSAGVVWALGQAGLDPGQQALAIALFTAGGTVVSLILLPEAFLRLCAWLLAHSLYRIRVLHGERVPETGGALLVANHVSWIDWLVIAATTRRRVSFLIYRHYYDWWALRWFFRIAGCVPIASGDAPEVVAASLEEATRRIEGGDLVVIFAEGTVTRTGHLQSIRRGYQRIAQDRGITIIPVHLDGLWGSVFSHEGGGLLRKLPRAIPYPVTVSFGEPLPARAEPWQLRAGIQFLSSEAWAARQEERLPLHLALLRQHRRGLRRVFAERGRPTLSRGALVARALALRDALALKLGPARNVGVLVPHGQDAALCTLAVLYAGRVPVPLGATMLTGDLSEAVRRAGIDTLLCDARSSAAASAAAAGASGPGRAPVRIIDAGALASVVARAPWRWGVWRWRLSNLLLPYALVEPLVMGGERSARRAMNAPAVLLFSAGSTGQPKIVVLSHHNVLSNVDGLHEVLDLRPDDRILGLLPFSTALGFAHMLWTPLLTECGVVWTPDPLDAREVGQTVAQRRATIMFATPRLLERYVSAVRPDRFGSLRLVIASGERLLPLLRDAFQERFGLPPLEAYTATECASLIALNTPDVRGPGVFQRGARHGSVGHPLPGVAVEVVDPSTLALLPHGEVGTLRLRGPGVMLGYLDDPAQQERVLRNGWYVSGDNASLDEDGFLFLADRAARVGRRGGVVVPHATVEEAIAYELGLPQCPPVVLGRGTAVPAVGDDGDLVVLHRRGSLDPLRVVEGLRRRGLPPAWIPRVEDFVPVDEIPLLPSGTVDYRELARLAAAQPRAN
ncbi:MAG: MFS transporter [Planctomycetota bacterium]